MLCEYACVVGSPIPVITGLSIPYRIQENTRVEFPCFPQGIPHPIIDWYLTVSQLFLYALYSTMKHRHLKSICKYNIVMIIIHALFWHIFYIKGPDGTIQLSNSTSDGSSYSIHPITQSLIISDANQMNLDGIFRCEANNTIGSANFTYTASIITDTGMFVVIYCMFIVIYCMCIVIYCNCMLLYSI